jgi:hypothetical protein
MSACFIIGWIHEGSQADGINSMIFQNLETIFFLTIVVVKLVSGSFHLGQPTDVGTFCKRIICCRRILRWSLFAASCEQDDGKKENDYSDWCVSHFRRFWQW